MKNTLNPVTSIHNSSSSSEYVFALAGNPNVGKSTVFNALTGNHQHTGNWPGKTVTVADGFYSYNKNTYHLVDVPGTYSLMSKSADEEAARDFICFGEADGVIIVCDATCMERNLILALQTLETTKKVVLCVNLMDEAECNNIKIDTEKLSEMLGIPVVPATARNNKGLDELKVECEKLTTKQDNGFYTIHYDSYLEEAISVVEEAITLKIPPTLNPRWVALKLIDYDESIISSLNKYLGYVITAFDEVASAMKTARNLITSHHSISPTALITRSITAESERLFKECVSQSERSLQLNRKIDKIVCGRFTGSLLMLLTLFVVLWITVSGANYPSELLNRFFIYLEAVIRQFLLDINLSPVLCDLLTSGMLRILFKVISVMLPPMAIFFPLFTLLEDLGYLPRIAFNLDSCFNKASSCGKQALTMLMGFGCNAAGVTGCRIIDSPREKLIAIITNSFVPCNGKFPTLIAIITMFFISESGFSGSFYSSLLLTGVILLGIIMTLIMSKILSSTLLRGEISSFSLELPPYRRPQIGRIIVRSVFDRTLFILGRAICVAAPSGIIIWLIANLTYNDITLLRYISDFLNPFASILGLDGVLFLAFILGFSANEIVIPIAVMAYMSGSTITEAQAGAELFSLLRDNGWTYVTAVSTMLFSLFHWPCSTTCMTIYKETKSVKWTLAAFIIPTVCGMFLCILFKFLCSL